MNAGSASLGRYLIRRLLQAAPLVLGILTITFVLIHLAPGDPLIFLAGEGGNAAFYADMRARYGLDQPLIVQFGHYIVTTLHGDLGYSFSYQQPVLQVIVGRLPATLLLMGTALALSTTVGLLMGVVTAIRPHSALDHGIAAFTLTAYAMPVFWLGQLLVLLFAVRLNLLPVQGMVTVRENYTGIHHVLDVMRHLTLPALTLALPQLALTARLTRTSLRESLAEEYISVARAKGLSERVVLWRHALRNALLPIVTVVGGHIGVVLTGAALTETIFAWPGLGRLLLDAALKRDYPLLMAIFLLVSATVIVVNLITDLIYTLLDPRVRFA
ncbi:MAG: ABC transporter permease [Chloroflexota bacterium]|nr:ABC transporter permease [Chloroflexota bacterium]